MLDCVVVGAGLAGLAAATTLAQGGRDVVVLEARDRVGGRVETIVEQDAALEMGGQWISPSHEQVLGLVEQYGLELLDPADGSIVVRVGGASRRVPTSNEIEDNLSPFEMADLGQGLLRFRRLAERVAKDAAWVDANGTWLGQQVDTWAHGNLRTPGGREWFARVFDAAMGAPSDSMSLLEGLRRVDNGVDMESLIAVNGGARQQRIAGGAAQLCERLAEGLEGRIRLGQQVVKVVQDGDTVSVTTADGDTVQARQVVLTLPPKLVQRLEFVPALPSWRQEAADKIPAGNVIKAALVYDEPWWKREGMSGQLGSDEGAMRVIFDNSDEGGRGVLMGFFEGGEASGIGKRSDFLRRRAMEETVRAAFGEGHPEALAYVDRDWSAEPFTGGCHGAHFAPGVWSSQGPTLAQAEGRVHFAGSEYARKYNGYMEGALRSGREVAQALLG